MDEAMMGDGQDQQGVPQNAEGPSEVEAILAALEQGKQPGQVAPAGVPDSAVFNHPAVQQMAARLNDVNNQQGDAEIARQLLATGLPPQHVPDVVQLFTVMRGLKQERDKAVGMLQQLDQSELVIQGKANELEKKYGKFGVKASDLVLLKPESAEAMETLAKGLALVGRRNKVHERAKGGADSFEASSGPSGQTRADYLDLGRPGIETIRAGMKG